MDNIIEELISIEGRANELMTRTLEEQRDLSIRIRTKADEIKNRIEKETSHQIQEMYQKANTESAEKIEKISIEAKKWHEDTERIYNANSEQWEREIFERIIGMSEVFE